jgi:acetyl esterase/lipase
LRIYFRTASTALRDENDKKDPRASVLLYESFDDVPPCLFIVAELDPLRDDSYGK